jgi:nitric oxide reductase activation protein
VSASEDHDTAVYEALDALTASFKSDKYRFDVKDVRVTDDSVKPVYDAICSKVTLLNKTLIRRIKAIKTYNVGGKNPGQRTGKLDRKAMYRYKHTPDIFYNNTYKQLESDLAFGVILDISGSMHGRGIENGRITMIILHETLKALGINHCILGHTCYGGMYKCDIERYQSFREDATYTVCKNYALANLEARSGNCDSGALYYMEKAMDRVRNRDKIVLMFSDGAPTECTGTDLITQVKNMERKGIKVIGIGINFPNISKYYTDYANGRNLQDMLNIVSLILEEYVLKKKDA